MTNDIDLDKYNFVVNPGSADYDERIVGFTLEQHIQQSKAFRAYTYDRWGDKRELTPQHYEWMDEDIAEMERELSRREWDGLSDDELLLTARSFLVNLTANDSESAKIMGFDDEFVSTFRNAISKFDTACEDEQKQIEAEKRTQVTKAATDLLNKLVPSSKPFILTPPKKRGDGEKN